jgi:hypothetical protein
VFLLLLLLREMMNCINSSSIPLSDHQHRLATLLSCTKDVIGYADDTLCEEAFAMVAEFARSVLKEKERRAAVDYNIMSLNELLALAPSKEKDEDWEEKTAAVVVKPQKAECRKRGRSYNSETYSTASSSEEMSSEYEEEEEEQHRPSVSSVTKKRVRTVSNSKSGGGKRKNGGCGDSEVPLWDVFRNPNVTEVVSMKASPEFRLEVMARPAGQGKHTPEICYLDAAKMMALDKLPRIEKSDQQKRRRILDKLRKAIVGYAAKHQLPMELKTALQRTDWGVEMLSSLEFSRELVNSA